MDESLEITITIGEDKVRQMLTEVQKAKLRGDSNVIVEYGAVNFMVYAMESAQLKKADEQGHRD